MHSTVGKLTTKRTRSFELRILVSTSLVPVLVGISLLTMILAFKLRKGLNLDPVKKRAIVFSPKLEGDPEGALDSEAAEIERKKNEPPNAEDLEEFRFPKPYGIPSYAINDRSKIEIASISHEFQQSMAENHFTASSFEIGGWVKLTP